MARASTRTEPATVVVVDDDPVALGIMEEIIGGIAGSSIAPFGDPGEALAWCQTCTPDVIVSDYQMPEIDGLELLERLRAEPHLAHVPIVMVTAMDDRTVRQRALELGANDFLNKPLDAAEVTLRIINMILVHQTQRATAVRAQELALQMGLTRATLTERERAMLQQPRTIEAVLTSLRKRARTPVQRERLDAVLAVLPEILEQ